MQNPKIHIIMIIYKFLHLNCWRKNMSDISNNNQDEQEPFEQLHKQDLQENGKGMRAVPNHAMINFLHWTRRSHPEIRNLRYLSENDLFQLVNEFTHGRFTWNEWHAGFSLLLEGRSNKEGYAEARAELQDLGL
jgi:hypothetical protein